MSLPGKIRYNCGMSHLHDRENTFARHLAEELALVTRMIRLACAGQHSTPEGEPCAECLALIAYVEQRLVHCPYGESKPTCRKCPVHCYRPTERERIKAVMRYAGPRLLQRGDFGALKHLLADLKPAPPKPGKQRRDVQ